MNLYPSENVSLRSALFCAFLVLFLEKNSSVTSSVSPCCSPKGGMRGERERNDASCLQSPKEISQMQGKL